MLTIGAFQFFASSLDIRKFPFLWAQDFSIHPEQVKIQPDHASRRIIFRASQLAFNALKQGFSKCRRYFGFDDHELIRELFLTGEIDGICFHGCAITSLTTKGLGQLALRPKKHLFCRRQIGANTYI